MATTKPNKTSAVRPLNSESQSRNGKSDTITDGRPANAEELQLLGKAWECLLRAGQRMQGLVKSLEWWDRIAHHRESDAAKEAKVRVETLIDCGVRTLTMMENRRVHPNEIASIYQTIVETDNQEAIAAWRELWAAVGSAGKNIANERIP